MLWFVNQDGRTEGPLPEQRVVQLIRWGKISRRAYVCDEQLTSWVSIQRTAFAALFAPIPLVATPADAEDVRLLGALRGGPWRYSTRALQRLSAFMAAASVFAGALELASNLAMSGASGPELEPPTLTATRIQPATSPRALPAP